MKLLTASTEGWQEIEGEGDAAIALQRTLSQTLLADRLVVLTGLGTSRCIADSAGNALAPTMADLWQAAKETAGDAFDGVLAKVGWSNEWREDIELLLSRCQMALELGDDDQLRRFIDETEAAIVAACRFITAETELPVHEAFLRKVARRSTRLPRTQVFTTNYDLAFETAAARTGFSVIDGFSHAYPQRFDGVYFEHDFATRDRERAAVPVDWVPNVLQLHKLHGSVDWLKDDTGVVRDSAASRPLIVYPRSSKFEISYQQPFLELMARYQRALRRPDTGLLVIGSGFHDDHIAHPLMAALRANVRLNAIIIAPSVETSENESIQTIAGFISRGDRRLGLLAASFEEAVPEIPDLVTATEAERHEGRLEPDPPNA
jgi:SIR2-like domain